MQAYLTLVRRELGGFFFSITGYVIIAGNALLLGLYFWYLLQALQTEPTLMPITEIVFNTYLFWFILLLAIPVITMRLFALERFSGTFETLMTTPVTDTQVVAAKFSAAVIFYAVMWLPMLAYILIIRRFTGETGAFDYGTIGSTFFGVLLIGGLFLSLGCFASALTRSQVTAAMITTVLGVLTFLTSLLADRVPTSDWKSQALALVDLPNHLHDFARGIVDTRPIVLCLSVTFFFLFLTLRVIESRRWK
ncbi:MAG: ABC transporter permease subunit [Akkermansiaceae bacterium]|nr:ABC transporter permease subunit [Verrucomicrobiales bacterium]